MKTLTFEIIMSLAVINKNICHKNKLYNFSIYKNVLQLAFIFTPHAIYTFHGKNHPLRLRRMSHFYQTFYFAKLYGHKVVYIYNVF